MTAARRALAGAVISVASMAAAGCGSSADDFYDRIYECDITATEDVCGTTRDGEPIICHAVQSLGGKDFCAPACDDSASPPAGAVCVGLEGQGPVVGALIETCRPTASGIDAAFGCPAGLNCYRTDLVADDGLCLNIPVCTNDTDCPADGKRRVCAGALVREAYPEAPLATNNLHCVQAGCSLTGTDCPPGESCMPEVLPASGAPDICVPNCDANLRCPPNFICSAAVSGPIAPMVCIPGLPGYRCAGPQDCMVGSCEDTGLDFSVCTIPCAKDADCGALNGVREQFVCAHRPSDGVGHCVTAGPFAGSPCLRSADCTTGLECYTYSPYQTMQVGECRVPCGAGGACEARGGVPHVCLAGGAGGCYPGRFGLPCADSSQCMAGFACETVTNEIVAGGPITQKICTISCDNDADCDANPFSAWSGYCEGGHCQLAVGTGDHCERDGHCRSRMCQLPPTGTGTCLARLPP